VKKRLVRILWKKSGLGAGFERGPLLKFPVEATGQEIEKEIARRWPSHQIWNTSGRREYLTVALIEDTR
jgi:hypothetical protein